MVRVLPLVLIPVLVAALVAVFLIGRVDVSQYDTQIAVAATVILFQLVFWAFQDEIVRRPKLPAFSSEIITGGDIPPSIQREPQESWFLVGEQLIVVGMVSYLGTLFWDWQRFYVYGNASIGWEYVLTIGDAIALVCFGVAALVLRLALNNAKKIRKEKA